MQLCLSILFVTYKNNAAQRSIDYLLNANKVEFERRH